MQSGQPTGPVIADLCCSAVEKRTQRAEGTVPGDVTHTQPNHPTG